MDNFNTYRRNPADILRKLFLDKNIISRLILINTAVFIIIQIASTLSWLFGGSSNDIVSPLGSWLSLPSNLETLITRPWTIFTYMFLHEGFFHILFNMLLLYFGGMVFREFLSERKLLFTYLIGGLFGALFFVAAFNIFPVFAEVKSIALALGASASVLAIVITVAAYVPDYNVYLMFFGKVKLKYLAIAMIVIDLLSIQSGNAGGHIAHLGGAMWGFIYGWSLRNGKDFYSSLYKINFNFSNPFKSKNKFSTERPKSGRPMTDDEYNKTRSANQHEIDRILDKISQSGYSSLTKQEKELLFKSSNKR